MHDTYDDCLLSINSAAPAILKQAGFKVIDTEFISTRGSSLITVNVTYTAKSDFGEFSITVDPSHKGCLTVKVSGLNQEDDLIEEQKEIKDTSLMERFTKNVDWEAVTNWAVVNMAKCIAAML